MKCKTHPKYKGIMKPRVPCEDCWLIYLGLAEICKNCGCQATNDGYENLGSYMLGRD